MTKPNKKKIICEEFIIMMAENGFHGFSLYDLADRDALSYRAPSALYKHFESKEAILYAAVDIVTTRIAEQVQTFKDCKFLVHIWLDDYTKNVLLTRKKVKRSDFKTAFEVVSREV